MQVDAHVREAIAAQPKHVWMPTVEPDGRARDGAEVCELASGEGRCAMRSLPDCLFGWEGAYRLQFAGSRC